MTAFQALLIRLVDALHSYILVGWLVVCGVFFTIKTGCVQLSLLKPAFAALAEKRGKGVSSFQALMISTASRVGAGNIVGVATAIAFGGKGAVFWMWVSAFFGAASAFVESTLAQAYKTRTACGFRGGPAYYIEMGLKSRSMGVLFALCLVFAYAYGFNALQAYNIVSTLSYYGKDSSLWVQILAVLLSFLLAFVIFGGVARISVVSSVIVPVMAVGYVFLGLWVLALNVYRLPALFFEICREGLSLTAFAGGTFGSVVVIGIKRGLLSHEAGMGSAPNAAASAEVSHPVVQGLVQALSVFIDTMLICSVTAFVLLLSDVAGSVDVSGMQFVQQALSKQVGPVGVHLVTLAIFLFAFSSLMGNYYYAESNVRFIKDHKMVLSVFRVTCVSAVFVGAHASFHFVWGVADLFIVFMTVINLIAIVTLHPVALYLLRDYRKQYRAGNVPVFFQEHLVFPEKMACRE